MTISVCASVQRSGCLIGIHHHIGRKIHQDPLKAAKVPINGHWIRLHTFRFERDSDSCLETRKPAMRWRMVSTGILFPVSTKNKVTDVGIRSWGLVFELVHQEPTKSHEFERRETRRTTTGSITPLFFRHMSEYCSAIQPEDISDLRPGRDRNEQIAESAPARSLHHSGVSRRLDRTGCRGFVCAATSHAEGIAPRWRWGGKLNGQACVFVLVSVTVRVERHISFDFHSVQRSAMTATYFSAFNDRSQGRSGREVIPGKD
jgi:hypothetical protein